MLAVAHGGERSKAPLKMMTNNPRMLLPGSLPPDFQFKDIALLTASETRQFCEYIHGRQTVTAPRDVFRFKYILDGRTGTELVLPKYDAPLNPNQLAQDGSKKRNRRGKSNNQPRPTQNTNNTQGPHTVSRGPNSDDEIPALSPALPIHPTDVQQNVGPLGQALLTATAPSQTAAQNAGSPHTNALQAAASNESNTREQSPSPHVVNTSIVPASTHLQHTPRPIIKQRSTPPDPILTTAVTNLSTEEHRTTTADHDNMSHAGVNAAAHYVQAASSANRPPAGPATRLRSGTAVAHALPSAAPANATGCHPPTPATGNVVSQNNTTVAGPESATHLGSDKQSRRSARLIQVENVSVPLLNQKRKVPDVGMVHLESTKRPKPTVETDKEVKGKGKKGKK